eukprot:2114165-Prymnesium_polylepis.2
MAGGGDGEAAMGMPGDPRRAIEQVRGHGQGNDRWCGEVIIAQTSVRGDVCSCDERACMSRCRSATAEDGAPFQTLLATFSAGPRGRGAEAGREDGRTRDSAGVQRQIGRAQAAARLAARPGLPFGVVA